ncbi:hypothetical protein K435DRAFT_812500 [Dendrothele bispora CBS 962.96]|uniref:Uncharacterized protein n=1 Tax=Dendrothele bispora (strain CBS 962.96) TaxID=1314807 RepID=A0A4S8KP75_DENBC|nr:hypothetical protein K435DRAFT_812500 [Dendrothele bispora CBS 962.96]
MDSEPGELSFPFKTRTHSTLPRPILPDIQEDVSNKLRKSWKTIAVGRASDADMTASSSSKIWQSVTPENSDAGPGIPIIPGRRMHVTVKNKGKKKSLEGEEESTRGTGLRAYVGDDTHCQRKVRFRDQVTDSLTKQLNSPYLPRTHLTSANTVNRSEGDTVSEDLNNDHKFAYVPSFIDEPLDCSPSPGTDLNSSGDIDNIFGDYHSSTTNDSSTTNNSHNVSNTTTTDSHNVSNTTTTDSYNNIYITVNDSPQKYERRDRRNRWNVTKFITHIVIAFFVFHVGSKLFFFIENPEYRELTKLQTPHQGYR